MMVVGSSLHFFKLVSYVCTLAWESNSSSSTITVRISLKNYDIIWTIKEPVWPLNANQRDNISIGWR